MDVTRISLSFDDSLSTVPGGESVPDPVDDEVGGADRHEVAAGQEMRLGIG
jgi:hypothetical protein